MNTMRDILSAFDNVDNKPTTTNNENSSMKTLLESFNKIQEGASINLSVYGDTSDEASKLYNDITGNSQSSGCSGDNLDVSAVSANEPDVFQGTLSGSGIMNRTQEGYNNEPDEEYQDLSDIIDRESDDLHKSKNGYNSAQGGDNPMSVKESELKNELSRALREYMKGLRF